MSSTLELLNRLIACPSITPNDAGCLEIISDVLTPLGFKALKIERGQTKNLWVSYEGSGEGPLFVFAGHVDVVPPGEGWNTDPFKSVQKDGFLYGRGTQDMKSSDAAFTIAAKRFIEKYPSFKGSIALLLTSDEEGDGKDGTVFAVEKLQKMGICPTWCIVGEPSCSHQLGDTIKNGRRGSINGKITIKGIQGHVAYPEKVKNPIHSAGVFLSKLTSIRWDEGTEHFPPTSLQVSNIHSGTGAVNVVPATCEITFNLRFNPLHSFDSIKERIKNLADETGMEYEVHWQESAQPFQCKGKELAQALSQSIENICAIEPTLSTSGGTSDARFISKWCPEVVEFGPTNDRIHKLNERIEIKQLDKLTEIYLNTLEILFKVK